MQKSIQVQTNDMKRANFKLEVEGEVEKFATITPPKIILAGTVGTPVIAAVNIIQEKKHPFKIKTIRAKNGEFIRWEVIEEKIAGMTGYTVRVENLKKEAGSYFDTLTIETDNKDRPEIKLAVSGRIEDINSPKGDAGQPVRTFQNNNG